MSLLTIANKPRSRETIMLSCQPGSARPYILKCCAWASPYRTWLGRPDLPPLFPSPPCCQLTFGTLASPSFPFQRKDEHSHWTCQITLFRENKMSTPIINHTETATAFINWRCPATIPYAPSAISWMKGRDHSTFRCQRRFKWRNYAVNRFNCRLGMTEHAVMWRQNLQREIIWDMILLYN